MTSSQSCEGAPAMPGAPEPATSDPEALRAWQMNVAAARQLLIRTAELPNTKRELLDVLSEYRAALYAFAVGSSRATPRSLLRSPEQPSAISPR
jgi:hypothetical protein